MTLNLTSLNNFKESSKELRFFFPNTEDEYLYALCLIHHPSSPLASLPLADRISYVKERLNYSFPLKEEDVETLTKYALSAAQRALSNWLKVLHQREEFIASLPYDKENAELKDSMLARTPKLWEDYRRVLRQLEEEDASVQKGTTESLLEKGLI